MTRDPAELAREQEPRWDELRHRRNFQRIQERRHGEPSGPRFGWLVTGGMVTAAAAAGLVMWVSMKDEVNTAPKTAVVETPEKSPAPSSPAEAPAVQLAEGVAATLFADVKVSVLDKADKRVAVGQENGRARYTVTPGQGIEFEVVTQGVTVRVLGTVFDVTSQGKRVDVAVERGHVQVTHLGGVSVLHAGQSGEFYGIADDAVEATRPTVRRPKPAEPKNSQELLTLADQARRDGNDKEAAAHLRKLLRLYQGDSQAVAARFTLGRIETARGRHLVAAGEFQHVQQLAPHGPLAEDALAEEAWNRHLGAEPARAQALSEKYLELYPSGPHRSRMQAIIAGK